MPDTIIYFIRHGETEWNARGKLQGRLDIPLNATGRSQALRNGSVLADILDRPSDLDYVVSPLLRTRETMEIVRGAMHLQPDQFRLDERLIEISFGEWEGRTWDEIKKDDAVVYRERKKDSFNSVIPGGESYAMVMTRVLAWLKDVSQSTVAVSHGGIMRCLRGHVLGLPEKEILHLEVPQDKVMIIEDASVRLV
jgi:probable phosphoglycerate mutase